MKGVTREHSCDYIYADGTLVELYKEKRDGIEVGETVDITFGYCEVSIRSKADIWEGSKGHNNTVPAGRIVIHRNYERGFITLAKGGKITATMPSIENGSENTKSKGIAVQYVKLTTAKGLKLSWTDCTSVICSQFTVQDDAGFKPFDIEHTYPGRSWGSDARIWKVTDLRPKPEAVAEVMA